ncbi:MAG: hypothetical protein QNJ42_11735 [Crocosphaera sp.]|nr:hypothetical protein [Crocosphaera sp.]
MLLVAQIYNKFITKVLVTGESKETKGKRISLLINPYNVEEITTAMEKIAIDDEMRSQLKPLGLQQSKKFNWQTTAEKILNVLETFLN